MPQLATRQFGPIEYGEEAVLEFPRGLPAFEDQTRFLLLERQGFSPIVFLQSVLRPDLCFLTLPLACVDPGYSLSVAREDLEIIGVEAAGFPLPNDRLLRLAILSVTEDRLATANLLAPVLVNLGSRRGVQAVRLDSLYSHQQKVPLPDGRGTSEDAPCS